MRLPSNGSIPPSSGSQSGRMSRAEASGPLAFASYASAAGVRTGANTSAKTSTVAAVVERRRVSMGTRHSSSPFGGNRDRGGCKRPEDSRRVQGSLASSGAARSSPKPSHGPASRSLPRSNQHESRCDVEARSVADPAERQPVARRRANARTSPDADLDAQTGRERQHMGQQAGRSRRLNRHTGRTHAAASRLSIAEGAAGEDVRTLHAGRRRARSPASVSRHVPPASARAEMPREAGRRWRPPGWRSPRSSRPPGGVPRARGDGPDAADGASDRAQTVVRSPALHAPRAGRRRPVPRHGGSSCASRPRSSR